MSMGLYEHAHVTRTIVHVWIWDSQTINSSVNKQQFSLWQKLRTGLALHAMRTGLALYALRARLDLQPSGAISLPSMQRRIMCIKHKQSAIVSTSSIHWQEYKPTTSSLHQWYFRQWKLQVEVKLLILVNNWNWKLLIMSFYFYTVIMLRLQGTDAVGLLGR